MLITVGDNYWNIITLNYFELDGFPDRGKYRGYI